MSAPLEKLLRDARIDLILARIEKDESIINEVISHLDNDSRSIKFNAIHVLGEVGQKSANAVSKIVSCLEDDDWSICREAARALGKIGDVAKEAIPQLSTLLQDEEESIRKEAAVALGKIGIPAPEAISSLIKALNDKSESVRTEVAIAIGELGPNAYEAIPYLMESLKDVSWTVRTSSAQSISLIGKESIKAIPSLIKALRDPDWRVRYRVVVTLAELGEPAVPALLEVLKSSHKIAKKEALDCLGEMKIADPSIIIDNISSLLSSGSERIKGKAADALRNIGKDSIPALLKAIEKTNLSTQKIIISAIGGIGSDAKETIPDLIKFKKDLGAKSIFSRFRSSSLESDEEKKYMINN